MVDTKKWFATWKNSSGIVCASASDVNKETAKTAAKDSLDAFIAERKAQGEKLHQRDFQLKVFKE